MTGIYAILNIQTGMMYVGRAQNIAYRWSDHRRALNQGNHHNLGLQADWDTYGSEIFCFMLLEIIDLPRLPTWYTKAAFCTAERKWIKLLLSRLYNSDNVAQSMRGKETPTCAARMANSRKSRAT
jgi:group I intron endonuclease